MTKADIVSNISDQLGIDKTDVQATVESFMKEIKTSLESGENLFSICLGWGIKLQKIFKYKRCLGNLRKPCK